MCVCVGGGGGGANVGRKFLAIDFSPFHWVLLPSEFVQPVLGSGRAPVSVPLSAGCPPSATLKLRMSLSCQCPIVLCSVGESEV